jgi:hypothetical protein
LVRLDNKIKCRGCEEDLKFNIESKTSNILSHVRDTKLAKHKDIYGAYLKMKGLNAASIFGVSKILDPNFKNNKLKM